MFKNLLKKNNIKTPENPKKHNINVRDNFQNNLSINVNTHIISLQNSYENGNINDLDLSKTQLEQLIAKYEKDIYNLNAQLKF